MIHTKGSKGSVDIHRSKNNSYGSFGGSGSSGNEEENEIVGGHIRYSWVAMTLLSSIDVLPLRLQRFTSAIYTVMNEKDNDPQEKQRQKKKQKIAQQQHQQHQQQQTSSSVLLPTVFLVPREVTVSTLPFFFRLVQRLVLVTFHRIEVLVEDQLYTNSPYELFEQCYVLVTVLLSVRILDGVNTLEMHRVFPTKDRKMFMGFLNDSIVSMTTTLQNCYDWRFGVREISSSSSVSIQSDAVSKCSCNYR